MNEEAVYHTLLTKIEAWANAAGFAEIGVSDIDLTAEKPRLQAWLEKGYQGSMAWLGENLDLRNQPDKLVPHTQRIISFRMDYLPADTEQIKVLKDPSKAYISRYALGRDYHKLIRKRLANIAKQIEDYCLEQGLAETLSHRAFVDSAPVLERPLAEKAGIGWVGKHTLILNRHAGSWFFLGEIFTSLPLPTNKTRVENACGDCKACLQVCPTDAFPRPYELDARRCISYLTIENKGPIPKEFREVMGNRVFGCDDCQAICPWNKYAKFSDEKDFQPRHGLDTSDLLTLFCWTEEEFLEKTAGSPIRRIGYENWLRNLSVGLGNAPSSPEIIAALESRRANSKTSWLSEHFTWALDRQTNPPKMRKRKLKAVSPGRKSSRV